MCFHNLLIFWKHPDSLINFGIMQTLIFLFTVYPLHLFQHLCVENVDNIISFHYKDMNHSRVHIAEVGQPCQSFWTFMYNQKTPNNKYNREMQMLIILIWSMYYTGYIYGNTISCPIHRCSCDMLTKPFFKFKDIEMLATVLSAY